MAKNNDKKNYNYENHDTNNDDNKSDNCDNNLSSMLPKYILDITESFLNPYNASDVLWKKNNGDNKYHINAF
jgi:hypothetical protein